MSLSVSPSHSVSLCKSVSLSFCLSLSLVISISLFQTLSHCLSQSSLPLSSISAFLHLSLSGISVWLSVLLGRF
jgi:hypothetical protein